MQAHLIKKYAEEAGLIDELEDNLEAFAQKIIEERNHEIAMMVLQSKVTFESNFGNHIAADWVYRDICSLLEDE